MCHYCYIKKTGFLSECEKCLKRIYLSSNPKNTQEICSTFWVEKKGIKGYCGNLTCKKKEYYRSAENVDLISYCEDCFLKKNGHKDNCIDCNKEIIVYESQKEWRKRCYNCWIKFE